MEYILPLYIHKDALLNNNIIAIEYNIIYKIKKYGILIGELGNISNFDINLSSASHKIIDYNRTEFIKIEFLDTKNGDMLENFLKQDIPLYAIVRHSLEPFQFYTVDISHEIPNNYVPCSNRYIREQKLKRILE